MNYTTNYNLYKPEPTDAVDSNIPNSTNMDTIDATIKSVSDTAGAALPKAGGTMTGALNMNGNGITGIPTSSISSATDAVNKAYVDAQTGDYLPIDGGTMEGVISMGGHKITNLPTSGTFNPADAVPKSYVTENAVTYDNGLTIDLNANNNTISALATPSQNYDAATKKYVDDNTSNKLPLAGGTMDGDIDMGGNEIQFSTMSMYEDSNGVLKIGETAASGITHIYGDATVSGELSVDSNKIVDVATPTASTDAANKAYVDGLTVEFVLTGTTLTCSTSWATIAAAYDAGTRVRAKMTNSSNNAIYTCDNCSYFPSASFTAMVVNNALNGATEIRFIRLASDGTLNYYTRTLS